MSMNDEKTTLLFFHIEDCHWCEWVREAVIYWMKSDRKSYGHVDFFDIDGYNFFDIIGLDFFGATGDELADELDVVLFPTIIVLRGDVEVGRVVGVALKEEYWHSIDLLLDQ